MNTPVKMTLFRTISASRRNEIYFQEMNRKNKIDRTETSFASQSTMTEKELKEAAKHRRELADKY